MQRTLTERTTLGAIAADRPRCIPVLERLGLDYCCRGDRTLAEATSDAGLNAREVLAELESCEPVATGDDDRTDWRAATMSALADHIEETHHAYVRRTLARLETLLPRVVKAHGDEHPELVRLAQVIDAFADDMRDHMVREERVLFPWLRRLERRASLHTGPPWSVRRPIDCMEHDHDEAAEALREVRRLTSGYAPPAEACASFKELYAMLERLERDTHRHIHKENNILFPAGVEAERRSAKEAAPSSAVEETPPEGRPARPRVS